MEESDDKDSFNEPPPPSLPPNYVTLTMLKERWLQKKQEEEEAKLNKQQNMEHEAKEERAGGSRDVITPTTRNQNRGKSGPAYVPRRRQQIARDRRGGESWVRKHEEPESSGSVVIGGNQEIKEKKHWEGRKPRAPQNVKYPENVAEKGEIPTVVSEESNGKGKSVEELQLDGDNGGVVSENGVERDSRKGFGGERRGERKEWRGGFKRHGNGRMNSRVHKQVGELEENEKKEEGVVGGAEERKEKAEKGRQSGIGQSAVKIDKSSQDLLLDDRKDANVSVRVSGQQLSMNSKVYKQVGELGEDEKKAEEGVVLVVEDTKEKGEKGRQSGIGQSAVKIDMSSQDFSLDDSKDGNDRTGVSSQQQSINSKVHEQVGEFGDEEKKVEEGVVRVAEDGIKNGDEGRIRIRTCAGPWANNIENRFRNDNRKYGNVRRISGSAVGRHGYVGGYGRTARQRVEQVENRLMWVKKGENSSGNVTEFNSQVYGMSI
ncbi:PREDICTED: spore wall protein 2 isoform X5 [Ipomoea nil]|uniref:spore wall protein 2 isoform X5 n=1 Tax=Ipomoea nil TaxID=35883 RepID=UPI000901B787|nr:PREDICTED: spore wall protein 2 isoform X5 [Ipomoea nil]